MFFEKRYKKNYIKVYESPNKRDKFALTSINGDMKQKLLSRLNDTFELQGERIRKGGIISNNPMLSLISSGTGALGLSGLTSGSLFIATANPATLMTIGSGVGSAVMGGGVIVAHAPFIPVAGAVMPFVAPLIAFQAISTIMIMNKFKAINKKLVSIEKSINRVLQRNEATLIGEILSSFSRLEILENEFYESKSFNNDMMIRLALLEDVISSNFERYKYLYEGQSINKNMHGEDLKYKNTDASLSIILSIFDIRVDLLRLRLTVQENPGFIKPRTELFQSKVKQYQEIWSDIEKSPKKVEHVSHELKETIKEMSWWKKNMPNWLLGEKDERKELESQIESIKEVNKKDNRKELENLAKEASKVGKEMVQENDPVSLLYWKDELGSHSYYTSDITLSN